MRTVFLGTPEEAVPTLAALLGISEVVMAISQPARPRGRGLRVDASPVEEAAAAWGIPVRTPTNRAEFGEAVEEAEADVAVVAAYGRIVPGRVLAMPEAGFVNVHFSLLPRWRGASPVTRALLAGDAETGVTLMVMDEGLDTGPMLATSVVRIRPTDTTGTLTARLAGAGAALVAEHLAAFVAGDLTAAPQDDALATAAAKVSVEEAFLDPARHSHVAIDRAIRAFHPRPGAGGMVDGTRLKVLGAVPLDTEPPVPGMVEMRDGDAVLGAVGGAVRLVTVQPEGKAPMDAAAWMHGRRGTPGRFERP
ncbi:MAG TPA: methionyl-tRNA formyltransferase [Acidimicrobiia bacterium]|nr:methionyl-tRNA formyltransferase [Acidimicrobiia bacterium]